MTDRQLETIEELQRLLIGKAELTPHEVAAGANVEIEQARRLWRALGFPPVPDDQRFFTHSDVQMLRAACALIEQEGTDPKVLLQLTRVTGQSLARMAEAQIAAMSDRLEKAAGHLQGPELAAAVEAILPGVEPFLRYVWRRHLLAALRRFITGLHDNGSEAHVVAVGFADLVGFTAISQQVDEHQLAEIVDRFEELAYDHVAQGGGRVIKMIGDEVMFAADSALDAARIALDLARVYSSDDKLPEVRVGLALGPVLSWQGDLFGPIVNLASRLVNIARPGTVLISEELAKVLGGNPSFTVRTLRPLRLQGLGKVTFAVLRPPLPQDQPADAPKGRRKGRAQRSA
jgi:adenylate cyclase